MGLAKLGFSGVVLRWANGLRFPYLFLLTAALFVANVFIPDVVPFADELIMGLVAMLLANIKRREPAEDPAGQSADTAATTSGKAREKT